MHITYNDIKVHPNHSNDATRGVTGARRAMADANLSRVRHDPGPVPIHEQSPFFIIQRINKLYFNAPITNLVSVVRYVAQNLIHEASYCNNAHLLSCQIRNVTYIFYFCICYVFFRKNNTCRFYKELINEKKGIRARNVGLPSAERACLDPWPAKRIVQSELLW